MSFWMNTDDCIFYYKSLGWPLMSFSLFVNSKPPVPFLPPGKRSQIPDCRILSGSCWDSSQLSPAHLHCCGVKLDRIQQDCDQTRAWVPGPGRDTTAGSSGCSGRCVLVSSAHKISVRRHNSH